MTMNDVCIGRMWLMPMTSVATEKERASDDS